MTRGDPALKASTINHRPGSIHNPPPDARALCP